MTNNKTPLQEALDSVVWPNIRLYEFHRIQKAAQAYADLPSKIEGMKWKEHQSRMGLDEKYHYTASKVNKTLDDILNLLKEGV
jgi:hypothetical protein